LSAGPLDDGVTEAKAGLPAIGETEAEVDLDRLFADRPVVDDPPVEDETEEDTEAEEPLDPDQGW
jgi:hypothetical protein